MNEDNKFIFCAKVSTPSLGQITLYIEYFMTKLPQCGQWEGYIPNGSVEYIQFDFSWVESASLLDPELV